MSDFELNDQTSRLGPEGASLNIKQKHLHSSILLSDSILSLDSLRTPQWQESQIEGEQQLHAIFDQMKTLSKPKGDDNYLQQLIKKTNLQRFKNNIFMQSYKLPSQLTKVQAQIIKDPILDSENISDASEQRNVLQTILQKIPFRLLAPQDPIIITWDILTSLGSLYFLWISLFMLTFLTPSKYPCLITINVLIVYMLIDLLLNCNKSIIMHGQIIENKDKILKLYLKNIFGHDILFIASWITLLVGLNEQVIWREIISIIQMLLMLRKINQKYQIYYDQICSNQQYSVLFDLFVLITSIYLFAHFTACIWHYVAEKSSFLGTSWLIAKNIENASLWVRYNSSFYWATMTMVTVGYGDITPQNQIEMITCSVVMFISTCVFAYSMNSIGMLLKNINDSQYMYRKSLAVMDRYMKVNYVDRGIQSRVKNYLKYYNDSCLDEMQNISKILDQLSQQLRTELTQNIQITAAKKVTQLVQMFPRSIINISKSLEQLSFTPGEFIYHQNDQENQSMYFVAEGRIALIEEQTNKFIQDYTSDSILGMYQFFTGFQTKTAAQALDFTKVYKLSRTDCLQSLTNEDREIFHNIKDKIINGNYLAISQCQICKRNNHESINCPMIQYIPDIERLTKSENFFTCKRRDWLRSRTKFNALAYADDLNQQVIQFQQDYLQQPPESANVMSSNTQTYVEPVVDSQDDQYTENKSDNRKYMEKEKSRQSQFLKTPTNKNPSIILDHRQQPLDTFSSQHSSAIKKPSYAHLRSENQIIFNQNVNFQLDEIREYQNYMPHNNFSRTHKFKNKIYNLQKQAKYSFYFQIQMKAYQIRALIDPNFRKIFSSRTKMNKSKLKTALVRSPKH